MRHPGTGSGQYLLHLLRYLRDGRFGVETAALCDGVPPGAEALIPAGTRSVFSRTAADPLGENVRKLWWEQVTFPRLARALRSEVAHVPYFAPPLVARGLPVVATIHDVIPLIVPEYAPSALARLYNRLVSAAARRAALVLVDSEHSRKDVERLLRVPASRLRVVYLAADDAVAAPVPPEEVVALKAKYGLEDPVVLYLGGLDKRKNVPALLRALASLPPEVPWRLAISGRLRKDNPTLFPDLESEVERLSMGHRVRFLGFVPDEEKAALYRAASCFAFPSIYEGFGMDPLEALACGTPVVCSNRSCLPELMGQAALMVDPDDTAAFASALQRVLTDADLRADLSIRGPLQAAEFAWSKTADETVAAYRAAAGKP